MRVYHGMSSESDDCSDDGLQVTTARLRKTFQSHMAVQTDTTFKEIMDMKGENVKLKQTVRELTEVNLRWQKYNEDRDEHVRRLRRRLEEQKATIATLREGEKKLRPESCGTKSELLLLLRLYSQVLEENEQLKGKVRAAQRTSEDCRLLQADLDFSEERREKEAAQTRLRQFMQELANFKSKYRQCKEKLRHLEDLLHKDHLSCKEESSMCRSCSLQKSPVIFFTPCDSTCTYRLASSNKQFRLWQRGPGDTVTGSDQAAPGNSSADFDTDVFLSSDICENPS